MLQEHDENIEVEFITRKDTMDLKDWVELCLQNEAPMFKPLATSSAPAASAVKGTEQYTDGTTGVDLGSHGSALSCLGGKLSCSLARWKACISPKLRLTSRM